MRERDGFSQCLVDGDEQSVDRARWIRQKALLISIIFRSCGGGGVASVAAHHARAAATAILDHTGAAVSWRAKLIIRRITLFFSPPPDQNVNCSISSDVPTDAFSRTRAGVFP
jgi:hypothetical protein